MKITFDVPKSYDERELSLVEAAVVALATVSFSTVYESVSIPGMRGASRRDC